MDADNLFEANDTPATRQQPAPMTDSQRQAIRRLFDQLGVADARSQFEVVEELTGVHIRSARELDSRTANRLIAMLPQRIAHAQRPRSGNTWADRDEDTWIDKL